MKAAGKLDKYGKPNENTPKDWKEYKDYRYLAFSLQKFFLKSD